MTHYQDMEMTDLRREITKRGLKYKSTKKQVLRDALLAYDLSKKNTYGGTIGILIKSQIKNDSKNISKQMKTIQQPNITIPIPGGDKKINKKYLMTRHCSGAFAHIHVDVGTIEENIGQEMYEVLFDRVIPYFDFDKNYTNIKEGKMKWREDLEYARDTVQELYNGDVHVFCDSRLSQGKWKNSFHLLVRGAGYYNKQIQIPRLPGFDHSVYSNGRQLFRTAFMKKTQLDSTSRGFRLINMETLESMNWEDCLESFDEFLIQNIEGESMIQDPKLMYSPPTKATQPKTTQPKPGALEDLRDQRSNPKVQSVLELLDIIPKQEYEWHIWRNMMWAIKNIADDLGEDLNHIAHSISKLSSKYSSPATDNIYYSVEPREGKRLGFATLLDRAYEINPQRTQKWMDSSQQQFKDAKIQERFREMREMQEMDPNYDLVQDISKLVDVKKMESDGTFNKVVWAIKQECPHKGMEMLTDLCQNTTWTSQDIKHVYEADTEKSRKCNIDDLKFVANQHNPVGYKLLEKNSRPQYRKFDKLDPFCWLDFDERYRGKLYVDLDEAWEDLGVDMERVFARTEQECGVIIKKDNTGDKLYTTIERNKKITDFYIEKEGAKGPQEVNFSELIKRCANKMTRYSSIDCHPKCDDPKMFNLWQGIKAELTAPPQANIVLIKPILEHINMMCSQNLPISNWFILWMYYVCVKTEVLPETAVFLYSRNHGTGKNTILDFLKDHVVGHQTTLEVAGFDNILAKHNTLLQGVRLAIVNEAASQKEKFNSNWDKMKTYITEKHLVINPKGLTQYKIRSALAFAITSNHKDGVKLEKSDRRYFCVRVPDTHLKDHKYFKDLRTRCFNDNVGAHFYTYLKHRGPELIKEGYNIMKTPMTPLKEEIIGISKPSYDKFLDWLKIDISCGSSPEYESGLMSGTEIYESYKQWAVPKGERVISHSKFGSMIKERIHCKKSNGRMKYVLNTL